MSLISTLIRVYDLGRVMHPGLTLNHLKHQTILMDPALRPVLHKEVWPHRHCYSTAYRITLLAGLEVSRLHWRPQLNMGMLPYDCFVLVLLER